MSGGNKRIVINTRERAVSTDINRAAAFSAQHVAQPFRRMLNARLSTSSPLFGPFPETGSYTDTSAADGAAIAAPLSGDVFDGLVVLPQAGTLNLLVSPGVLGVDDPDGQAGSSDPSPPSNDDSRYKIVGDPGVQVSGALTVAAGSGSTRVDVVECQRQTVVLETDSRDVFDPSTGVFVPVAVNKVVAGRLLYRVRQGSPGAGLPASVQGWLPLCVIVVPNSAANVDGMTFYDVRPLVSDRVNAPFASSPEMPYPTGVNAAYADDHTNPAKTLLVGFVTSTIGMYKAGGQLNFNSPLDVQLAANKLPGYSPTAGKPWFLYAMFPGSLPRWVRYFDAPNPRIPSGPLGVLGVDSNGPIIEFGSGDTRVPPASTGLVASGPAVLLLAGPIASGPVESAVTLQAGRTYLASNAAISGPAVVAASTTDSYTLVANTHFPANARMVYVRFNAAFSGGASGSLDIFHLQVDVMSNSGARISRAFDGTLSFVYGAGGTAVVAFTCELPRAFAGSLNGEPDSNLRVTVLWSTTTTRASQSCTIYGWRT